MDSPKIQYGSDKNDVIPSMRPREIRCILTPNRIDKRQNGPRTSKIAFTLVASDIHGIVEWKG